MNRSKFKEALNELSSEQRTALLYLEKLIFEKKRPVFIEPTNRTAEIPDVSTINKKLASLQQQINQLKVLKKEIKKASKAYDKAIHELKLTKKLIERHSKVTDRLCSTLLKMPQSKRTSQVNKSAGDLERLMSKERKEELSE